LEVTVPATLNKRVVSGSIAGLLGCALLLAGCELDTAGVPRVIPGPSVPSPVPLRAPYIWDTQEELAVWTGNRVSRGSFSIDTDDSNGAIVIQLSGSFGTLLLRGPDITPPATAIRAVRIRYRWFPETSPGPLSLWVAFDATNSTTADLQPRAFATLNAEAGWQEIEFAHATPLDVRYVYFGTYFQRTGVLKIDAITLVSG
jgi:hypothetical protein